MRTVSIADHMAINQLTVSLGQLTALGIDDVVRVRAKLVLALGRLASKDNEIRMIEGYNDRISLGLQLYAIEFYLLPD